MADEAPNVMKGALITGALSALLAVFFLDDPSNDIAAYYARMTHEFAAGNYSSSFHHMIPPLIPSISGVVAMLGIEAFVALKMVSSAFFLATLWPLYHVLRRILPVHLVPWGCLLFVVCPRTLRYGTMGSLESAKMFFLLLAIAQIIAYWERPRWRHVVGVALAVAGLSLARPEGLLFAPLLLALPFVYRSAANATSWPKTIGRFVAATAMVIALCSPWLAYEYRTTGYICTDSRQVFGAQRLLSKLNLAEKPVPIMVRVEGVRGRGVERAEDRVTPWRIGREAFKGFFPPYLALAVVGIFFSTRRKWGRIEALLVGVTVFNILVFLAAGNITKRYTAPTIPLVLPWVVLGAEYLLQRLRNSQFKTDDVRRKLVRAVAVLALVICVWDGLSRVRRAWSRPNQCRDIGLWIRENRAILDVNALPPLSSTKWGIGYHSGRQPVVLCLEPEFAYWGRGDWVSMKRASQYDYSSLVDICQQKNVDVLITDKYFAAMCPTFQELNRHFELVADKWEESGVRVYRYRSAPAVASLEGALPADH